MSGQKRRWMAGLALVSVLVMLAAASAPAAKRSAGSYLELYPAATSDTTIQYSGRVNSASKPCRAGRAVELYLSGGLLTTIRTDRAGNWSVSGARPPVGTQVTAIIDRKVKKTRRHKHICGGDTLTKKAQ